MRLIKSPRNSAILLALLGVFSAAHAQKTTVTADTAAGKAISPDLVGIFFEDLNYAADGGLYAELIQNRSFDYTPVDNKNWNSLTAWQLVERGSGKGSIAVETENPLNAANSSHATLTVEKGGEGVGLQNAGFDGIPVKASESYNFSLFARQLEGSTGPLTVRLESKAGAPLAEAKLPAAGADWKKLTVTLKPAKTDPDARLVVLAKAPGKLALDMVSLFPAKTFRDRPNGLRADLAQAVADLHPKFMRFPGGCLVHGDGIDNLYKWKETIGPVEERKGQPNIWRYHQSVGLGYFEYFQLCEDIGAKPLPVVAAGVCCQNSYHKPGKGQRGLPMADMPAYVQDVLDLIEYANGPVTSTWGAKRAAAGHPAPFGLKYLGVGNEDKITPDFKERFQMIFDAVKAKHPEITVVGTSGPFPDGEDFTLGWQFADELHVPIVDEHYYKPPQWFWDNLQRYDSYDRSKSKVYAGEYAAHDDKRANTLRAALAEAAYLTGLERNGDVVTFASYAPLLARRGHNRWNPDMIYFTGTEVFPTINYHVQQLFSLNSGDTYLPTTVNPAAAAPARFAASTVRDSKTGDLILKLVNGDDAPKPLHVDLTGAKNLPATAVKTVLAAADVATTDVRATQPQTASISISPAFDYEAPAHSLTVIRIKNR